MKSYLPTCLKHQQTLRSFSESHDYGNKMDIFAFQNNSTEGPKYKYFYKKEVKGINTKNTFSTT